MLYNKVGIIFPFYSGAGVPPVGIFETGVQWDFGFAGALFPIFPEKETLRFISYFTLLFTICS